MKVMLLTDRFLPHAGGSRVYYYNLYKSLLSQFSDQAIILTKKLPGWQDFDRQESTKNLRIVRGGKPLETTKYYELPRIVLPLAQTLWLLAKEKIDLIHSGDLYPPGAVCLLLKKTFGIPYLAYCHGEISYTDRFRYQPLVRNRIYRGADAVIANSEYTRNTLLEIGVPDARIHKITPGVDLEQFSPRPANPDLVRQYSLQDKVVLLTVARLVSRKNQAMIIRSVASLHHTVPGLRYLIVGEGPDEENLRRLVHELGIDSIVTFAGRVPQSLLPDFYNLCDIFVLPNCTDSGGDVEGFGMVFLEANACGKPVIGGLSGGSSDAIAEGVSGFLIEPENIDALTAKLKEMLLNPALRQKLGSAGLYRARNEFNWLTRGRRLREISKDIVDRHRSGKVFNLQRLFRT